MDIFKFTNPNAPTLMEQGQIINGLTSKTWVERYGKEGEFTFTADSDSDVRMQLPIGAFISHMNSTDIMIVENHEINDDASGTPGQIKITGRGFETFFEQRIVGANRVFPVSETIADYALPSDFTWNQAVAMIDDHTLASALIDVNNAIPYMTAMASVTTHSGSPASIARTSKRESLYSALLSLLAIDGLGIKVYRPGVNNPLGPTSQNVTVVIRFGVDRSANISFSYDLNQVVSADYLWSNKAFKNAALITGKWVEIEVVPTAVEIDRRFMFIDGSDIDNVYTAAPTGTDLDGVVTEMTIRANEILSAQKSTAITKAQAINLRSIFRQDFDVGDIITVIGDYNEVSKMQITEYVEIEDSTGEFGYPTLSVI